MKIVFTLLTIAILCQVSLAGVVGRFKREQISEAFANMIKILRSTADTLGTIVKQTLEQLPETDAYAKYKKELGEFLEAYNEYKTKKGLCLDKIGVLFHEFASMTDEYKKEDAPEEAKKVIELIQDFGGEKLENEVKEHTMSLMSLIKSHKSGDGDDGEKLFNMMIEIC